MSKSRLIRAAAIAMMVAAFLCLYLWIVDLTGFMPRCIVKWATGFDCPGCGSQRAFVALLHGDVAGALGSNLILLPVSLYLGALLLCWLCPEKQALRRVHRWLTAPVALTAIAIIFIMWMVVRNILHI